MFVADIITRVRNIAGDINVLQFTDAMVIDWINDGIRECAINNNLLQKSATSNTVVGDNTYALPTDILKLHSVIFDGAKLRLQTLQEWEELNDGSTSVQTGSSTSAYVWAGTLNLTPTPDRVAPLVVNYTYDPPLILTTDDLPTKVPALPVGYHARLVDYCLAQVAQQDDDYNRYTMKMQEFATGVQTLKDQSEYEDDLYPSMSVSSRDMGWDY